MWICGVIGMRWQVKTATAFTLKLCYLHVTEKNAGRGEEAGVEVQVLQARESPGEGDNPTAASVATLVGGNEGVSALASKPMEQEPAPGQLEIVPSAGGEQGIAPRGIGKGQDLHAKGDHRWRRARLPDFLRTSCNNCRKAECNCSLVSYKGWTSMQRRGFHPHSCPPGDISGSNRSDVEPGTCAGNVSTSGELRGTLCHDQQENKPQAHLNLHSSDARKSEELSCFKEKAACASSPAANASPETASRLQASQCRARNPRILPGVVPRVFCGITNSIGSSNSSRFRGRGNLPRAAEPHNEEMAAKLRDDAMAGGGREVGFHVGDAVGRASCFFSYPLTSTCAGLHTHYGLCCVCR